MTYKIVLISLIFLLAFCEILLFSASFQKGSILLLILFGFSITTRVSKKALVMITLLILYSFYVSISALMFFGSTITSIFAIQSILFCIIFYMWFSPLTLNIRDIRSMRKLAYFIIILQILFSLLKLYLVGVDEPFMIGTMSHMAGQLSFIFPALCLPLLIFMMNEKNKFKTFVLIIFVFLFGIIGEKRSVIFLLPPLLLFSIYFINYDEKSKFFDKNTILIIAASIVSVFGIVVGIKYIPSLNIEETRGGSVSISYAVEYAISYLNMDFEGGLQGTRETAIYNNDTQLGRITLIKYVYQWLLSVDLSTALFGLGYGSVTSNSWVNSNPDIFFEVMGFRGAISGFILALVETGIVGAGMISSFFIFLFIKLNSEIKKLNTLVAKRWFRMLFIVFLIFCFDFFFYSTVLLRTFPIPIIFSASLASILIVKRIDKNMILKNYI